MTILDPQLVPRQVTDWIHELARDFERRIGNVELRPWYQGAPVFLLVERILPGEELRTLQLACVGGEEEPCLEVTGALQQVVDGHLRYREQEPDHHVERFPLRELPEAPVYDRMTKLWKRLGTEDLPQEGLREVPVSGFAQP